MANQTLLRDFGALPCSTSAAEIPRTPACLFPAGAFRLRRPFFPATFFGRAKKVAQAQAWTLFGSCRQPPLAWRYSSTRKVGRQQRRTCATFATANSGQPDLTSLESHSPDATIHQPLLVYSHSNTSACRNSVIAGGSRKFGGSPDLSICPLLSQPM